MWRSYGNQCLWSSWIYHDMSKEIVLTQFKNPVFNSSGFRWTGLVCSGVIVVFLPFLKTGLVDTRPTDLLRQIKIYKYIFCSHYDCGDEESSCQTQSLYSFYCQALWWFLLDRISPGRPTCYAEKCPPTGGVTIFLRCVLLRLSSRGCLIGSVTGIHSFASDL